MRIKKGDYVQIISGSEAGKRGRILRVLAKKNRVIVEGINYIFKHLKKSQKTPQGGRVEKEASIHISNVMLYCPHSQAPTRTYYQYEEKAQKDEKAKDAKSEQKVKRAKVRYSKKSKRQV